jgi:hypothetical protein
MNHTKFIDSLDYEQLSLLNSLSEEELGKLVHFVQIHLRDHIDLLYNFDYPDDED